MVIIYELGRYPVVEAKELQSMAEKMLSIVFSACPESYLKEFNYNQYKQQELNLIYTFIQCSIVDTVFLKSQHHLSFFPKVDTFLQSQKQKKYAVNEYSKLLTFYRFAKSLLDRKQVSTGSQVDILLQEELNLDAVKDLLQPYL